MTESNQQPKKLPGWSWFEIVLIGILLLLFLVISIPSVSADPYFVINTNNSGPGSLRQAITDANNNPGPDTISFAVALNGMPITLSGPASEDGNASGDLDIGDNGDLTIQGRGVANTIIQGDGNDRVLHICPGGGCNNTVTLSGMTIRDGEFVTGGGVFNDGGTLVVLGTTITGNSADYGGGIYNQLSGNISVDGSTVRANTANYGGGIFNKAVLNVWNGSTIGGAGTGNTATDGGGIYNETFATTVVNGSTVGGNTATNAGGGIYNNTSAIVSVNSGTVSDNIATNGAGIYNQANLTVANSSIIGGDDSGNTATSNGGGIYSESGTTVVTGSSVNSNSASWGAGIYNYFDSTTTVDQSTVSANTATISGGGICNFATLNIWNGSAIGGTGEGNTATSGGGVSNVGTGITVVDASTVSANSATNGGAIFNLKTVNVQNGSIIGGPNAGNTAANWGGGIYNAIGGTMTVTGSTISFNTTTNTGGGIYNNAGASITVNDSRILNNQATFIGGGLFNDADALDATQVTDSCIEGNSSPSIRNNQSLQQIATSNWWGSPTGPNTPGADTTSGNVNISGFLTTPILGCTIEIYVPMLMK